MSPMSALPPKADIADSDCHVRFVPKADITHRSKKPLFDHFVGEAMTAFKATYQALEMARGDAPTASVYRSQYTPLQIHASFANHSWNKLQCGQYVWLKNTALELKISAATNLPVKIA